MGVKTIDGYLLKRMIVAGANELNKNVQLVNELNVFPVPDGDTGYNMFLTIETTAKEVLKLNTPNASDVAKAASNGALRGARGNSGVILSQLFRGFYKGLEDNSLINTKVLASSFCKASEVAYKAVIKPREGTILTIASSIAAKAQEMCEITDDIEVMMEEVLKYANKVLLKTTDMLEELKKTGVVDSGGKGLILILEGAFASINSNEDVTLVNYTASSRDNYESFYVDEENIDIKFVYCTEFFINIKKDSEKLENELKNFLDLNGDSIVVVCDDKIIKIHVHTNNPGKVLEYSLKIGSLSNIKIENMHIQHTNLINFVKTDHKELSKCNSSQLKQSKKNIGIVSVTSGKGFFELFNNLGVDLVIEGGQSMNPSIEDFLTAINKINADNIIILPNNKNVILAAEQAVKDSNKNVYVLPTKTVPQGIAAVINFIPTKDINSNLNKMKESISLVRCAQVTYAVRDTVINEQKIVKGDILGIVNDDIEIISKDKSSCTKELIKNMICNDTELLTVYYGQDVSEEEANELKEYLEETYNNIDIEFFCSGQPLYYYIVAVE